MLQWCCEGGVVGGGWGLNTDHRGSDKARERAPGFKGTTASHVLSWEPVDFLSVTDLPLETKLSDPISLHTRA